MLAGYIYAMKIKGMPHNEPLFMLAHGRDAYTMGSHFSRRSGRKAAILSGKAHTRKSTHGSRLGPKNYGMLSQIPSSKGVQTHRS